MRTLRVGGLLSVVAVLVLWAAPNSSAAVEVGDDCIANEAEGGVSLVGLKRGAPEGLPLAAPSNGVVTGWRVRSNVGYDVPGEALQVVRDTGVPNQFLIVGESRPETIVTGGSNAFATRIPVKAGDRFAAAYTTLDVARCSATGDPGDEVAGFVGGGVGGAVDYKTGTELRVPMVVTIEPDADADGYGDETQDLCPQIATAQGPCPLVGLALLASARKGAATVIVTTDARTPVAVSGSIKLGGEAKGRARSAASLNLTSNEQAVGPGELAPFTLKFPALLKSRLRALPRGKSLKLKIVASAKTPRDSRAAARRH